MAKLGVRTISELVGRTDLLRSDLPHRQPLALPRWISTAFLHSPAIENSDVHFVKEDTYDFPSGKHPR